MSPAPLPPVAHARLVAALHLEAVLPVLARLAPHDDALRAAAAGLYTGAGEAPSTRKNARALVLTLAVRGVDARCRLAFSATGEVGCAGLGPDSAAAPRPGDLRLWFPSAGQFLRAVANRPALALPLGGWAAMPQVPRFAAAGRRLDALLRPPGPAASASPVVAPPALFAFGNLAVGLAGAAAWLRRHPAAPAWRSRLGDGVVTFACPAFDRAGLPSLLWIDLARLATGAGAPPRPPVAELTFADLDTLLAELAHRLDALAALGGGELRIRGHLLVAERLGLVLAEVSRLLNPAAPVPVPVPAHAPARARPAPTAPRAHVS